jgi:hypothetical protein
MSHKSRTVFTIAIRLMMLLVLSTFLLLERGLIPVASADQCGPNILGDNWFECDYEEGTCTHIEWIGYYDRNWELNCEDTFNSGCSEEEQEQCDPFIP